MYGGIVQKKNLDTNYFRGGCRRDSMKPLIQMGISDSYLDRSMGIVSSITKVKDRTATSAELDKQ
jgi:hypothetical protein